MLKNTENVKIVEVGEFLKGKQLLWNHGNSIQHPNTYYIYL